MKLTFFFLLAVALTPNLMASSFPTNQDEAFARAAKEKKPLLMDFSAIWCAPCAVMESTVFETPEFQAKAKAFELLKVDVDREASWPLKERYHVFAYPTVILATPEGREIYRLEGAVGLPELLRLLDLIQSTRNYDLAAACKGKTDDDLWTCARYCGQQRDTACVERAITRLQHQMKSSSPQRDEVAAFALTHLSPDKDKVAGYEKLLQSTTNPKVLVWAGDYLALFHSGAKGGPRRSVLKNALSIDPMQLGDEKLVRAGLSLAEAFRLRARILGELGEKTESKAAWKQAAAAWATQAAALTKPPALPRAYAIDRIEALQAADDSPAALSLAEKYREQYPNEFTYHWAAAVVLHDSKRETEALSRAQRGYELAYGDNRIRAGTLLIDILGTLHQREAARKIYEALHDAYPSSRKLEQHTAYFMSRLEEAWKKADRK